MESKLFRISLMALLFLGVAFTKEAYHHYELKKQRASVEDDDIAIVNRKNVVKRTPASLKKKTPQESPLPRAVGENLPNPLIREDHDSQDGLSVGPVATASAYLPMGSFSTRTPGTSYQIHPTRQRSSTASEAVSGDGEHAYEGSYFGSSTSTPFEVSTTDSGKKTFSISSIGLKEGILILKGNNLSKVKSLKIEGIGSLIALSQSSGEIRAMGLAGIQLALGEIFNLIVADSYAKESYPISIELSDGAVSARKLAPLGAAEDGYVMKWDAIGQTWIAAPDEVGMGQGNGGILSITRGSGLMGEGSAIQSSGTIAVNIGNGPGQLPAFNDEKKLVLNDTNKIEFHESSSITFKQNTEEFILGMFNDIFKFRNVVTDTTVFEVTGNNLFIQGKLVCLADGTNCPETGQDFVSSISIGEGLAPFGTTISQTGVISIADGGVTAAKLNQMGASTGHVLKWNGTNWTPSPDNDTGGLATENDPKVRSFAHMDGAAPEICAPEQTLKFDPILNTLICSDIVLNAEQIVESLQEVIDGTSEIEMKSLKFVASDATWMGFRSQPSSANVMWTLPASDGTSGQVLKTNGAGVLSWSNSNIAAGSIVNADISSGAAIEQSKIFNLVADLSLKEPLIAFPNDTTKYWRGDKSWQDLNTTAVAEGTNRYFTKGRVLETELSGFTPDSGNVTASDSILKAIEKISGNLSNFVLKTGSSLSGDLEMGGNLISGLGIPSAGSDAATKAYVDGLSHWTLNSGNISRSTGRVGIGTEAPSAVLDINSTTSGVLIPRMTETQRNAIPSPTGMQVYNTTTNELNYHNGTNWKALGVSGAGYISNNEISSTAAIERSKLATGSAKHILVNDASGVMSSIATLPVSHGGTGVSILTPNRLYVSNGTGSALEVLNCGPLTYLVFDVIGAPACSTLPVASSGVSGIVSNSAQTFSGTKTFEEVPSALKGVKFGNNNTACNTSTEGTIRYNTNSKRMEFCNSTSWSNISSGTVASLVIGAPSSSAASSTSSVDYVVSYGAGADSIHLSPAMITLSGTDTSGCVISVSGSGMARVVNVSDCSGTGTVAISIALGSATSTTNDPSPEAGPSIFFNADNAGPNAPSAVALGNVPANFSSTPTISYTAATDIGGSSIASHSVRIIKTSDSSEILPWTTHSTGNAVSGLTLEVNTEYTVFVRAVDTLGNIGVATVGYNWTSIDDPCLASPAPGTTCTGGAIFLGNLASDRYMTTPGGCSEIPAGQIAGSGATAYPNTDFTPTCSGTDALTKSWNDGNQNWYVIPGLVNYSGSVGVDKGAINIDANKGDVNTTYIVATTEASKGGYHAAARYCDKLVYGGYQDWYLPNRFELNLMWINKGSVPGLNTLSWYSSSTQVNQELAWMQRFSDGYQNHGGKATSRVIRCVRRF